MGPIKADWVFLNKDALFGYLMTRIKKKDCHIWNQPPQICKMKIFSKKQNSQKLGPKVLCLGIFGVEI